MRLIQNMGTIAEYPQAENASSGEICASGRPRLIKIAVVGASGVGKTALVVRFLTKRFIGDYERNAGNLYSRQIEIDGEVFAIQVQDTPGVQMQRHSLHCNEQLNKCLRWADAVVVVFSITDYKSYELLGCFHQHIRQVHPGNRVPVVIVANKADLLHIKEVEPQHGLQLASMLGCNFYEVSVSENYKEVFCAFHSLCKEVSKRQTSGTPEKRRSSLISRPKSPNMQDLKRRFKQALSAKVRTVTSV
ncbi:ras-like protein family member 11B [Candoia aspera]|uniref:ras-like protein family member 11B n=1 Tax=Candoia aspera TaxID=51853 RepID=UPI002FD80AD4